MWWYDPHVFNGAYFTTSAIRPPGPLGPSSFYFDGCYFDGAYFDASPCNPAEGDAFGPYSILQGAYFEIRQRNEDEDERLLALALTL